MKGVVAPVTVIVGGIATVFMLPVEVLLPLGAILASLAIVKK